MGDWIFSARVYVAPTTGIEASRCIEQAGSKDRLDYCWRCKEEIEKDEGMDESSDLENEKIVWQMTRLKGKVQR